MEDISLKLFEDLNEEFEKRYSSNKKIQDLIEKINEGADYKIANQYSLEVGDLLADTIKDKVSSDILPNGKMYYNIANKTVSPMMKNNYELVSDACQKIQTSLNKSAGLGIKAIVPKINQDRIDGLIDIISGPSKYDDIKYVLDESIPNFSQSIVDDSIRSNASFQSKSGLSPKITRTSIGKCCKWCQNLSGAYNYSEISDKGNDVFRRHSNCRCIVTYHPINGKVQNSHTKKTLSKNEVNNLEIRREIDFSRKSNIANSYAKELIAKANFKDKIITNDLKASVVKSKGRLEGLNYRIKSEESLTRKLQSKSMEKNISISDYSKNVADVLRYTSVSGNDNLVNDYYTIIDNMNKKGYNIYEVNNTFSSLSQYKGINTILKSDDGYLFELQFHTEQSYLVKESQHKLYEEFRLRSTNAARRNELDKEMAYNASSIVIPTRVDSIVNKKGGS